MCTDRESSLRRSISIFQAYLTSGSGIKSQDVTVRKLSGSNKGDLNVGGVPLDTVNNTVRK